MNIFRFKHWSPYFSGAIIGFLQLFTILFFGRTLGASAAFMRFEDWVSMLFGCGFHYGWQVFSAIGIFVGAFVSAKLSRTPKKDVADIWLKEFNIKRRYIMAFLGGILLAIGAKLANGCTSGNGISGTAQLDLSSIIVLCSIFAGGIVVSNILRLGKK